MQRSSCAGARSGCGVVCVGNANAAGTGVSLEALQVGAHFGGVLVTKIAVVFESFVDDAFELGREIGIEARRRSGLTIEDGVEDVGGAFAAEGKLAGGHFVEDGAEREKIGAGVE